jgi:hypothetical protein
MQQSAPSRRRRLVEQNQVKSWNRLRWRRPKLLAELAAAWDRRCLRRITIIAISTT